MAKIIMQGDPAPDFLLPDEEGNEISLKSLRGMKTVLFFYPQADTPGCTLESIEFSKLNASFEKAETQVIGVSADSVKDQCKFRDKYGLSVPLLSDEALGMLKTYGVWVEKNMYGKKYMGIERSTFLIDFEGRIERVWRKVKAEGHAAEVLVAARSS